MRHYAPPAAKCPAASPQRVWPPVHGSLHIPQSSWSSPSSAALLEAQKEKRQHLEAESKERGAAEKKAREREAELAQLRARAEAFPKELEAAVKKAVQQTTERLTCDAQTKANPPYGGLALTSRKGDASSRDGPSSRAALILRGAICPPPLFRNTSAE
jgi:predicted phage gp36 major capsid-like protein